MDEECGEHVRVLAASAGVLIDDFERCQAGDGDLNRLGHPNATFSDPFRNGHVSTRCGPRSPRSAPRPLRSTGAFLEAEYDVAPENSFGGLILPLAHVPPAGEQASPVGGGCAPTHATFSAAGFRTLAFWAHAVSVPQSASTVAIEVGLRDGTGCVSRKRVFVVRPGGWRRVEVRLDDLREGDRHENQPGCDRMCLVDLHALQQIDLGFSWRSFRTCGGDVAVTGTLAIDEVALLFEEPSSAERTECHAEGAAP